MNFRTKKSQGLKVFNVGPPLWISGKKITFGLTPECDFPADIHQENNGSLTLILDSHDIPTDSQNLSFIKNSIAVTAIAVTLGVEWDKVIERIQSFTPTSGRCQVKKFNDIGIIETDNISNSTSNDITFFGDYWRRITIGFDLITDRAMTYFKKNSNDPKDPLSRAVKLWLK